MVGKQEAVDNHTKVLLGTTPNGKEIYMVREYNQTVRSIAFGDGGKLPECLQGGFSSIQIAMDIAKSYIATLDKPKAKAK